MRFVDHTQWRSTVSRTPLDEWSARRPDLYLTIHNTHKRETTKPPVGFEPTISAGERSQTYALDRALTETGNLGYYTKICFEILRKTINLTTVGVLAEIEASTSRRRDRKFILWAIVLGLECCAVRMLKARKKFVTARTDICGYSVTSGRVGNTCEHSWCYVHDILIWWSSAW
jgi:hypothetical protein